jgi:ubiquinone/menaquinone biosynthesis C-methylase UbiE
MNAFETHSAWIASEYERRARIVPDGLYDCCEPANILMNEQAARSCTAALKRASLLPLLGRRVADIGCGFGWWLLEFVQWRADPALLAGIDLIPERVEYVRQRLPQADLHIGGAHKLPWPDDSFDLVTQFTVFSSMLDPIVRRAAADEMLRILKPDGAILWFDLRVSNPANPNCRGIPAEGIRSLFRGCETWLQATVLAPPLSRRIAGWSWPLAELLYSLPLLRTHYAGLIRKRPTRK